MAEVSAFVYGWIAGIVAVIVWILYGIDTLLQLMRLVNNVFSHLPGFAHLANGRKGKDSIKRNSSSHAAEPNRGNITKFDVTPGEGLEGLTGSTKRVPPITAAGLCMMSWYGPDGTTGAPIECRLFLENNVVTIYQLLRLGDTNVVGASNNSGGKSSDGQTNLTGSKARRGNKDYDTHAARTLAGVTVAEHRKGRVSVLHTTVMELKHFNKAKKSLSEQSSNNNNGGWKSSVPRNGGGGSNRSESGSFAPSQRSPRRRESADAGAESSETNTTRDSGPRRRESGSSSVEGGPANSNTNKNNSINDPLADGVTRPGVDPLFTGRVLIWRTMDGRPLFESIHAPPSTFSSNTYGGRRGGGMCCGGGSNGPTSPGSAMSFSASASADGLFDDRSVNSSVDDGEDGDETHSDLNGGASEGSVEGRQSTTQGSTRDDKRKSNAQRPYPSNVKLQRTTKEMNDMSNWSCVIIKFERARESERWHTLLSGLREARAWHEFAKTLPNPDTINTFLSRFFFQNMRLNGLREAIVMQIRKKLRELPMKKFPRNLGGQLELDEFLIGTQIPWISDVSEPTVSSNGEVGFDFNLMYKGGEGGFTLFFRLALEFLGIRVPHVVVSVKLIELEATVHISIGPPPSKKFWIGGHKPPVLRLEVHQGCASGKGILHRVLTSLPDLSGIMTNLIKLYLFTDMVLPYMDDFPLPSVVKSPKGSQRDLRVRTFDRQRAAKISSAPVQSTSAPVAAHVNPIPSSGNDKNNNNSTSIADLSTSKPKDEISKSSKVSTTAAAAAAISKRQDSTAQKPSEKSSTTPIHTSGGSPVPSEKGKKDASSLSSATPSEEAATAGKTKIVVLSSHLPNPSFGLAPVQDVSSPIQRVPSKDLSQASFNAALHSDKRMPNLGNSKSTSPLPMVPQHVERSATSSVLNRSLTSEAEFAESTDALHVTVRKRSGSSNAVRNLKNFLKVKGKDMTRESVSRPKEKLKH